jgi:hypothetical protein
MLAHLPAFFKDLVQHKSVSDWLPDPRRHGATLFVTLMAYCLVWYISLVFSSRRSAVRKLDDSSIPGPTNIMKNLAPPGHRPTNAKLDISPFHLARGLASPTKSSSDQPLPDSDIPVDGRPFTNPFVGKKSILVHQSLPVTLPPQGRNFSGLAKAAPVSYETMRQRGMLDAFGSPTEKYARQKRLEELMGGQPK